MWFCEPLWWYITECNNMPGQKSSSGEVQSKQSKNTTNCSCSFYSSRKYLSRGHWIQGSSRFNAYHQSCQTLATHLNYSKSWWSNSLLERICMNPFQFHFHGLHTVSWSKFCALMDGYLLIPYKCVSTQLHTVRIKRALWECILHQLLKMPIMQQYVLTVWQI